MIILSVNTLTRILISSYAFFLFRFWHHDQFMLEKYQNSKILGYGFKVSFFNHF